MTAKEFMELRRVALREDRLIFWFMIVLPSVLAGSILIGLGVFLWGMGLFG